MTVRRLAAAAENFGFPLTFPPECSMKTAAFLLAAGFLMIGRDAVAQRPEAGDRVRIHACEPARRDRCTRIIGTLVSADPALIVLRDSSGVEQRVATGPASELQVSRGHRSHWLLGLGIGAVLGGSLGVATALQCDSDEAAACYIGAPLGLGGGMVLGALIGSTVRSERWRTVDASWLTVSAVPAGGGVPRSGALSF